MMIVTMMTVTDRSAEVMVCDDTDVVLLGGAAVNQSTTWWDALLTMD